LKPTRNSFTRVGLIVRVQLVAAEVKGEVKNVPMATGMLFVPGLSCRPLE